MVLVDYPSYRTSVAVEWSRGRPIWFRVELGEIEAVLVAQPGVAQAPVAGGQTGRVLPGYMVPAAVMVLDALPLDANGKLNRRGLPVPDYGAGAGASQAPAAASERALCEVFAQVLGLDQAGVDDSFFDLGGHSLLAAVLVARLMDRLGVKISLKTFMNNPTVRQSTDT